MVGLSVLDAPRVSWPSESLLLARRRLAAVLAVPWLAVAGYGIATSPPGMFRWPALALAAVAVGVVAGLWVGARRSVDGAWLVAGVAVACVANGLVLDPSLDRGQGFVVYWLPGLVAICAGALLSERIALLITVSAAAFAVAVVLLRTVPASGWSGSVPYALAAIVFTVCDGVAGIVATRALRTVGAAADAQMTGAEAERLAQAHAGVERRSAFDLAARLHDSIINTLSAVVLHGQVLAERDVRRACAVAADTAEEILRDPAEATTDPLLEILGRQDVPSLVRLPSIDLVGTDRARLALLFAELPQEVAEALAGGMREALVNVAKHSGQATASVEVREGAELEIRIRDEGVGFDGIVPKGRGLAVSVQHRCATAGVSVHIAAAPGAGTEITFGYRPSRISRLEREADFDARQLLAAVGRPLATQLSYCVLAMCAGLTLITVPEAGGPGSWLGLAALVGAILVGTARADHRFTLPPWAAVALIAVVPLVVWLPGIGEPGCQRVGVAWWGTDGALIPFAFLVFRTRSRWPTVAGWSAYWAAVAWVAASVHPAGCAASTLISGAFDAVVIGTMVFFRIYLARVAFQASAAHGRARSSRLRMLALDSGRRARDAELAVALAEAAQLLRELATGALDPRSDAVRERCCAMESYLRQLSQLDPDLGRLGEALSAALTHAHTRGVRLVLRTGRTDAPSAEAAAAVGAVLRAVIDRCRRGDTVTVVQLGTAERPSMTVTMPGHDDEGGDRLLELALDLALDEAGSAGWVADRSDLVEQQLIELRWKELTCPEVDPQTTGRSPAAAEPASPSSTIMSSSVTD